MVCGQYKTEERDRERQTALCFKMKTLCVVAAVLSFASLGHSASLACQNLTSPVQQGPDVGNFAIIFTMFVFLFGDVCVSESDMSLQYGV